MGRTERFLLERLGMEGQGVGGATFSSTKAYYTSEEKFYPNLNNTLLGRRRTNQLKNDFQSFGIAHKKGTKSKFYKSTVLNTDRKRKSANPTNIRFLKNITYNTTPLPINLKLNSSNISHTKVSSPPPVPDINLYKHPPWKGGYIDNDDASLFVTVVPPGWPPLSDQVSYVL